MNGVSRRRGSRAWPGLGDLVKAEEPPHRTGLWREVGMYVLRTHTDARAPTLLLHTHEVLGSARNQQAREQGPEERRERGRPSKSAR